MFSLVKNRFLLSGLLVAGLTGCASVGGVSEKDRSTTGEYDGVWVVEIQKAPVQQSVQQWNLSCGDMRGSFRVSVDDGRLQIADRSDSETTPVSKQGKFSLAIPLGNIASESGTSSGAMSNGNVRIFLRGSLAEKGAGHITYGIAEIGYGGCTAKTIYTRV